MLKLFKQHPASVNENYLQHMASALFFFTYFLFATFASLIHAFFPFLFEKTGSKIISKLNQRMLVSRER